MIHPWFKIQLPVVLCFYLISIHAFAQTQTTTSATSAATAGAGRASVEATDVHVLNPAALVHLKDRDFHTVGAKDAWGVGITDNSRDSVVPAGLSYQRMRVSETETLHEDLRLTLAGFISKRISLGVSGRQLMSRRRDVEWKQNNADVGLSFIATPNFGIGLVMYDVMNPSRDLPEDIRIRPTAGLGMNYIFQDFLRLRADVVTGPEKDMSKRSLLLGYESYVNRYFLFRMGWGDDRQFNAQIGSLGIGFDLPLFRLNYAYQTAVRGSYETRHAVDLGIPF